MGSSRSLNEYIDSVRFKEFKWGEHDCFIFTNTAFKKFHGFGYADDWEGLYLEEGKPVKLKDLRVRFGSYDFDEAIGSKLKLIDYIPPKGSLVATKRAERWAAGYALGISLGLKAAFLSKGGLIFTPIEEIDRAWVLNE